jgi:hypothetical protein
MLAVELKAGTVYNLERLVDKRRARQRQRIAAIRYLGMNGNKFMIEKVDLLKARGPSACNEGKIFLGKRSLEFLSSDSKSKETVVDGVMKVVGA